MGGEGALMKALPGGRTSREMSCRLTVHPPSRTACVFAVVEWEEKGVGGMVLRWGERSGATGSIAQHCRSGSHSWPGQPLKPRLVPLPCRVCFRFKRKAGDAYGPVLRAQQWLFTLQGLPCQSARTTANVNSLP